MKKIHTIMTYSFIALLIVYLVYRDTRKTKTVYVDNLELFSGFKMKQELEKKYKGVEELRKSVLDSLYQIIRIKSALPNSSDNEEVIALKKDFLFKKESFEKENAETMTQYNQQIWNQLNEYVKQYGEEQHYDFILGANGQGVLMYAKENKNVTKELLEFANSKFNGK